MIWFVFDLASFSESIHESLRQSFRRAFKRESSDGASHLYLASAEHGEQLGTYYLRTANERPYAQMIRQFGGHKCAQPSLSGLHEIPKESEARLSAA
jgi:hypothetical protein